MWHLLQMFRVQSTNKLMRNQLKNVIYLGLITIGVILIVVVGEIVT
jgi:hypothetical protein